MQSAADRMRHSNSNKAYFRVISLTVVSPLSPLLLSIVYLDKPSSIHHPPAEIICPYIVPLSGFEAQLHYLEMTASLFCTPKLCKPLACRFPASPTTGTYMTVRQLSSVLKIYARILMKVATDKRWKSGGLRILVLENTCRRRNYSQPQKQLATLNVAHSRPVPGKC
jgi:hypothetical protein